MTDKRMQGNLYLIMYSCIILCSCILLCSCLNDNKIEVYTDVEFVEFQFPKLENIEKVKFYYYEKNSDWEIGLQNIEFCGFIKIGEDFLQKIEEEYEWKETKKSKKKVPKSVLMEGEDKEYHFLYSDKFSNDGKYISHSWVGDFYLDKEEQTLYFECEW